MSKPASFNDPGCFCQGNGIGAEELSGDRMLILIVGGTSSLDSRMRDNPSAEVNSVMIKPQPDC